jgi:predicted DNA-binding protein with PD1-like motif
MQPWVLRLAPGNDLLEALDDARKAQGWTAVFVTAGIGSLHGASLRYADQREATAIAGPLELVSLSGTLSLDGPHLHASVSDAQGRVYGGHLKAGATVRTTAEILLTELTDVVFRRRPDARTGYNELVIEPRQVPK